jgi:4-methylaminobutanoate oxidase (formaldehyde-forming)
MDLWHMDIKRFGANYQSPDFTLKRITENYEAYYDIHYPGEERQSARPKKISPVYEWHKNHGAIFGEKSGWERVNYYARTGGDESLRPKGWAGKNWNSSVQLEHHGTRSGAGLFDESSFAKFTVVGEKAGDFLNYVCANNVVRGVGRTIYTQALNNKGGIESDYTVTQVAEDSFFIVTGTAFGTHDRGWIEKVAREEKFGDIVITDVTDALACFGLWGPNARNILQSLTKDDMSNEAFGFMTSREIEIAGIKVRATRITYVGELGWELYLPVSQGLELWEALYEAGQKHGLIVAGYKAIESLRLEKGYRAWAGEINSETDPFEAGLGFAVSTRKEFFKGRDEVLRRKDNVTKKLVAIVFDDITEVPLGNEPIKVEGKIIARMKSGGQGYTLGKAIGYSYLPIGYSKPGTALDVEFFGRWQKGTVMEEPLFDPDGSRIKS